MANSHSGMKLLSQYRQRAVPNYAPLVLMNLTANHANHADRKNHPRRGCSRGSSISRFTASDQCLGNLTSDGRWTYIWDAENRLVKLAAGTGVGPQISLQFDYDHQGRRIRQRVWNNKTWIGNPTNDVRYVYDGWNLLASLNSASSVRQAYLWGLDLSGTLQGAGGVGGLLAITDASQGSHFCAYDGNGNVTALVKADGSGLSAQYEYGPFGELLRATGPMAKANPFRFSTKYQDDETDLLNYGYRYYDPSTGRWPNRDPLGERGGRNLYGFVRNNPISLFDYLGLKCTEAIGKNGQPRIIFDPAPPKGGWKAVSLDFEKGGSAQAQLIDTISVTWEASVVVMCKCDSCYEMRHGVRTHEDQENGAWLSADPTQLPTSPFPVATKILEIIGGLIADEILGNFAIPIPADAKNGEEMVNAVKTLVARRPTQPYQGQWKDGKSPCDK